MTEVAQHACLPASTAHRLLQELVGSGLVQRGSDGHYRIGVAMYQLTTPSFSPPVDARAYIGQTLHDLGSITGYRARYGVLRGHGVSYAECGGEPPDRLVPVRGVMPAHATAAGQALLAHAGARVVERMIQRGLSRYTCRTPVTADQLHEALSFVRERGLAVTRGEWMESLCAIAAPVVLDGGRPVGALELIVPDATKAVRTTGQALLFASRTLARQLTESCSESPRQMTRVPLRMVVDRAPQGIRSNV
jgi:DNA-binding IclR family transcriptional regulator